MGGRTRPCSIPSGGWPRTRGIASRPAPASTTAAATTSRRGTGTSRPTAEAFRPLLAVGSAVRAALVDAYVHLWRLVAANLLWGAVLIVLAPLLAAAPLAGLVLLPVLALPTAGLFRMAAMIVRGEEPELRDGLRAWRRYARPALGLGAAITVSFLTLGLDLALGSGSGTLPGLVLAAVAIWAMLAVVVVVAAVWPLLVDPAREGRPAMAAVRRAVALARAVPDRLVAAVVVLALVAIPSTIVVIPLVTFSVAFIALIATRVVLPAADAYEAATARDDDRPGGAP